MSAGRPPIETVRAWVEGTLPAAERDAFAAAMADDRSLADLVATYAEVHAATLHPAPPCPVTADALRLDTPPTRTPILPMLRRVAPWAAAVLVVAGAAIAIPRLRPQDPVFPPESGPVVLHAIPAAREGVPPAPPAILTRYTPATDGRLAFLGDLDEARATARAAGRPLLIFVSEEMCPICAGMRHHAFREEDVARAANGFVLVAVSVSGLTKDDPLLKGSEPGGWPIFVVEDAAGTRRRVHGFPMKPPLPSGEMRVPSGEEVATELKKAYEAVPAAERASSLSWDDVHALARALRDADDESDPAARRRALTLVAAKDAKGPLGERARALLAADANGARAALESARLVAQRDGVAAAVLQLEDEIVRFDGTPYADDLIAVRNRLVRDGLFPVFVFGR